MAKTSSFDLVSELDRSELDHAIDQAKREIIARYDFRGTAAAIELDKDKLVLELTADSEMQLETLLDLIRLKFAKRGLSQKALDLSQAPRQSGMVTKQTVPLLHGLSGEYQKELSKLIREQLPKVKCQGQGSELRVISGSKDELQAAIRYINSLDFPVPLQTTNYR